jgi:hypothetical protein
MEKKEGRTMTLVDVNEIEMLRDLVKHLEVKLRRVKRERDDAIKRLSLAGLLVLPDLGGKP